MKINISQIKEIISTKFSGLDSESLDKFLSICEFRTLKNKEILFKEGSQERKYVYIISGVIRGYFVDKAGVEKNIFLKPEGTFTGSVDWLYEAKPSRYTFESILHSEVLVFSLPEIENLLESNPKLLKIYFWGLKENIVTIINRVESLTHKQPEERYEELTKTHPILFKKVFNKHIANYLGITPVSLSRIIKRMKNAAK